LRSLKSHKIIIKQNSKFKKFDKSICFADEIMKLQTHF
jgi:hypothetical protein